jgi:geranylgeranyl diphosphate synthase type I
MNLERYFSDIINDVNNAIAKYLESANTLTLYEASRHLFSAGGKRLRPLILVSSADSLGGDRKRSILAGAAIETLHTFTLVHDDIMDHDSLRRGLPTVHVKWGEPMAILAGDLLHAKAFQMLNDSLTGFDSDIYHKVMETFVNSVIALSEGQAMDMEFENRDDVAIDDYMEMIKKKTAYLIACSSGIGSMISGGDNTTFEKFFNFGLYLGISFQIVDDIIGITSDESELGKPVFSDIREGKRTLLVIKTLNEASSEELLLLRSVLGNRNSSHEDLKKAAEIIKTHSFEYAYNLAEKYKVMALSNLSEINFKNKDAIDALIYISDFTVKRRK